jgi:hypothetical protein
LGSAGAGVPGAAGVGGAAGFASTLLPSMLNFSILAVERSWSRKAAHRLARELLADRVGQLFEARRRRLPTVFHLDQVKPN